MNLFKVVCNFQLVDGEKVPSSDKPVVSLVKDDLVEPKGDKAV